ncbi:tRNA (adenosine(37)-N6)-threonylcarbamoyltransferase complex dimerization subunit type 1 TsaB [Bacteroidia bacterium]|nr:tRNA (adenosine(37)-N6)-threonylcarbamoyltransferase complex dimerization subunit type 1 TsaB [Bacteroidia bacterium]
MSCLLAIETSTKVCSIALSVGGEVVFERINTEGISHALHLGIFVSEAVNFARNHQLNIDAVAVSAGPGSYTGLRIGVSEAKGLCYGFNIPLIAIPTLKLLASQIVYRVPRIAYPLFCPMIDARRMEVYAAIYDEKLNEIRQVQADIVNENTYESYLENNRVVFFGDGAGKCKSVIQSPNAVFLDEIYPEAKNMIVLAEKALTEKNFVDVAYFEPFYLKEFQATVAKNRLIQ